MSALKVANDFRSLCCRNCKICAVCRHWLTKQYTSMLQSSTICTHDLISCPFSDAQNTTPAVATQALHLSISYAQSAAVLRWLSHQGITDQLASAAAAAGTSLSDMVPPFTQSARGHSARDQVDRLAASRKTATKQVSRHRSIPAAVALLPPPRCP